MSHIEMRPTKTRGVSIPARTFALVGLTTFILLLFGISIVVAQPAKPPSPLIPGYIPLPQMPPAEEFPARLINTAEPVTISNCYPCHQNLDGFKNPNLVFNHSIHFQRGIGCRACHLEFPHQPGKIIKPTMERCFICHGLSHGKQGLMAPSDCKTCHPKEFNLIPLSHTEPWIASLHKNEDPKTLGSCLMCHKQEECAACHSAKNVRLKNIKQINSDETTEVKVSRDGINYRPWQNATAIWNHPIWPAISGAKWISSSYLVENPIHESWRTFRKRFSLPPDSRIDSASILIVSDDDHTLKINGVEVGRGVGLGKGIQTYNIAPLLVAGTNTIEIVVHNLAIEDGNAQNNPTGLAYSATVILALGIPAPIVQPAIEPKPLLIDVSLPVTMSKCSSCHLQLDAFENPILVFNHPVHLKKGIRCLACHQEYPHQFGKIVKPTMELCFNCHNLRHGRQGLVAPQVCSTCHPPGFQLKPPSHDAIWRQGHGKIAKQNFYPCYMCHQFTAETLMPSFCQNCHGLEEMPHPSGWQEERHRVIAKVISREVCLGCHERSKLFCNQCHHKDYDPSWGPWMSPIPGQSQHFRVVEMKGKSFCLTCHSTVSCSRCHIRGGRI